MSNIKFIQSNSKNYKPGRTEPIKYIVIHYTAGNGDTAKNNADYYRNSVVKASAHYFVDEYDTIYQGVKDTDTAWAVGTTGAYLHPYCRNANSISIELCSRNKNGSGKGASDSGWYFDEETIDNAVMLVKELMAKHSIPIENVIRHFDVTGKICPAPFANDVSKWNDFKARLTKVDELTTINDIVWELAHRGIISNKELWLKKLDEDINSYFLAKKCINYIRGNEK